MELNKVAVIGLGAMGLPISINLAKSGIQVEVWNRSDRPIKKAVEAGAVAIKDLSEITAHVVLTVLPDIKEVREVLNNGLAKALSSNGILVVMGTVSPIAIVELSKELSEKGIQVLDAPMSGGDVGAPWAGPARGGDRRAASAQRSVPADAAIRCVGERTLHGIAGCKHRGWCR